MEAQSRADLIQRLDDLIAQADTGQPPNRKLWIEQSRDALIDFYGAHDHPEIRRFHVAAFPGLVRSDYTVRSGKFAEAEREAVLEARNHLLVVRDRLRRQVEARPQVESDVAVQELQTVGDRRSVFLVHGRDAANNRAMRDFLRALNLSIVEWEHAVAETAQPNPYVGDVVATGLRLAHAIVVLFTADDLVQLKPGLLTEHDLDEEREVRGQPRPNVIYEAGMAQAVAADRSVMVAIGEVKLHSDIAGRHLVRFDGSAASRHSLVMRLRSAGLTVDTGGTDWLEEGNFSDP